MPERQTETIDMTPTTYGEAYGMASVFINNTDIPDRVMDDCGREAWKQIHSRLVQHTTDQMVQWVLYRRVLKELLENDEYDVTQEDLNTIQNSIIEEEDDQRIVEALEDDEE